MGAENLSIRSGAETRMKFSDFLGSVGLARRVLAQQVFRLIFQVIEIWIGRERSDWHDELPFVCPRSASNGRKLVRKNELLRPGGLLSFPRTGCALVRSADIKSSALRDQLVEMVKFTVMLALVSTASVPW